MGKNGFVWWQGVVEDRHDPLYLGRCRVRILGFHTEDLTDMPTNSLPWAYPIQPITSAAQTGVGISPTGPVEGSWVVGFFRDGENAQEPVFFGTLGGIPDAPDTTAIGFSDPRLAEPPTDDHPFKALSKRLLKYDVDDKGARVPRKPDIITHYGQGESLPTSNNVTYNFMSDNGEDFVETPYVPDEEQYSDFYYNINLNDQYDWVEIADNGVGTNICLTDDSVTEIPIGFDFNYYGNTYDTLTVSSNGWASFEKCDIPYFWNFSIPFPLGPSAMLAPFMDDLDDNGKEPFDDVNGNCMYDDGEPFQDYNFNEQWDFGEEFNIFSYYDTENNRLIIQWDNVSNGEDDENCPDCVKETFQLVLLDQDFYPNSVNQGDIISRAG